VNTDDPVKFVVEHEGMKQPIGCARCGEVHELEDSNFHTPWCYCEPDEECDHGLCTDCLCEVLDGDG